MTLEFCVVKFIIHGKNIGVLCSSEFRTVLCFTDSSVLWFDGVGNKSIWITFDEFIVFSLCQLGGRVKKLIVHSSELHNYVLCKI